MPLLWLFIGIAAFIIAVILLISYLCYRMAFYSPPRPAIPIDEIEIPTGDIYNEFSKQMTEWIRDARALPHEDMSITSFDGLTLRGKYYECVPGAPIELMFHGYRGTAERDMSGGIQRCFKLGRNALLVNQRGCGDSDGNVISFGINEHRDCLCWIDFMLQRFGPDVRIILTGISMGASTVLMAAGSQLPKNVIGVLADCGYSSAKDIIKIVIRKMKLPAGLCYPFVKIAARLYGHFNLEELSPVQALKHSTVPVIFIHGECDDFVPCEMSKINYTACVSRKKLVTVPNAGHGLCYPVAPELYLNALKEFFGAEASSVNTQ